MGTNGAYPMSLNTPNILPGKSTFACLCACCAGNIPGILVLWLICAAGQALGAEITPAQSFRERCAALARAAEQHDRMTVTGREGWLFLSSELRHMSVGPFWGDRAVSVSRASKPEAADPLPAILDFNDQLKKRGVTLLLVPVPAKAGIVADYLPDSVPAADPAAAPLRLDPDHQAFYILLKTHGIKVLDLTPFFLTNRFHPDGALYCKQDSHWSGNACVLAAREIAGELRTMPGFTNSLPQALTSAWQTIEITGDLWQALGAEKPAQERVRVRRVGRKTVSSLEPLEPDQKSSVILLGDSHNLIFHAGGDMQTTGAGLADQLALELGQPVDLVAVRGSGATPARINLLRRAQKIPRYWAGKKIVIWCFAVREFTESNGWRKVPIAPP